MADGFIPKTISLESTGKITELTVYELRFSSKELNVENHFQNQKTLFREKVKYQQL
jgi:hypothetical protein